MVSLQYISFAQRRWSCRRPCRGDVRARWQRGFSPRATYPRTESRAEKLRRGCPSEKSRRHVQPLHEPVSAGIPALLRDHPFSVCAGGSNGTGALATRTHQRSCGYNCFRFWLLRSKPFYAHLCKSTRHESARLSETGRVPSCASQKLFMRARWGERAAQTDQPSRSVFFAGTQRTFLGTSFCNALQ